MTYKDLLNFLGVKIFWCHFEDEKFGIYIDKYKIIFLSDNLTEKETINFILHETAHALNKDILTKLSSEHLKMIQEAKANQYMIHKRCEAYLSAYDNKPDSINIESFLKYFNLDVNFYELAEREFKQLLIS
ncbi:hypothetical protein [Lactovum miscens]|uniref:IrrE N-terminal-like domain-containing protein n=1 Tax=Lactovum miscens TaxID=190387 RepID=A0A841C620_9LACT|nr:hypothetical protein [Lactovum miscens]MBB5887717.1 hypothetical protein [Lactovum miscens]